MAAARLGGNSDSRGGGTGLASGAALGGGEESSSGDGDGAGGSGAGGTFYWGPLSLVSLLRPRLTFRSLFFPVRR